MRFVRGMGMRVLIVLLRICINGIAAAKVPDLFGLSFSSIEVTRSHIARSFKHCRRCFFWVLFSQRSSARCLDINLAIPRESCRAV